ncbi:hypothetical protein [Amycolatopsis thermoflava]|uniref:hypothetical protein n=1 Tax=Amycolatopsis thermoflava TaxID=84480 RepID=UPI003D7391E6
MRCIDSASRPSASAIRTAGDGAEEDVPDEQRVVEAVVRRRFQRDRAGGEGQERHHASWPAFRAKHPRGHRITGRIYVFAGALLGLYIGWHTAAGPSVRVANLVGSALWLAVTATGWRVARRRRFGDHRRSS